MLRISLFMSVVLFAILGCTTIADKGDKYYERGNFETAAHFYHKAVKEDPDDQEARAKLQEARQKYMDKKLLQIKQDRLAKDYDRAINGMQLIFDKRKKWKIQLSGAVMSTLSDESLYISRYLKRTVDQRLNKNHPIVAKRFLKYHKDFFTGSGEMAMYRALKGRVSNAGLKKCKGFIALTSSKVPFFNEFTQKYCSFWGKDFNTSLPLGGTIANKKSVRCGISNKNGPKNIIIHNSVKCIKSKGNEVPEHIDQWYEDKFGLIFEHIQNELGAF